MGPNRPLEQGLAALQVSRLDARLAWGNEGGVNVRTDRPRGRRVDPQPEAVSIAGDLARRYGADVIVLHVREHEVSWEGDIDVETAAEPRHLVDVIVRNVKDEGTSARGEVVRAPIGQTARAILDAVGDEGAGLVVMGTRGLSEWGQLLMGASPTRWFTSTRCPCSSFADQLGRPTSVVAGGVQAHLSVGLGDQLFERGSPQLASATDPITVVGPLAMLTNRPRRAKVRVCLATPRRS